MSFWNVHTVDNRHDIDDDDDDDDDDDYDENINLEHRFTYRVTRRGTYSSNLIAKVGWSVSCKKFKCEFHLYFFLFLN